MTTDRVATIPNLVTLIRVIGVGVFWWVLLRWNDLVAAAWLVFAIGWTDWVDGYLARRLRQESRLGKMLDPVADRLMIASAVVGGLIVGVVPRVIAIPLLLREIVMATVAITIYARGLGVLDVRSAGKLATFVLYGSIPAFYLASAGVLPEVTGPLAWVTAVAGLTVYWFVLFLYLGDARRAWTRVESGAPDKSTG